MPLMEITLKLLVEEGLVYRSYLFGILVFGYLSFYSYTNDNCLKFIIFSSFWIMYEWKISLVP